MPYYEQYMIVLDSKAEKYLKEYFLKYNVTHVFKGKVLFFRDPVTFADVRDKLLPKLNNTFDRFAVVVQDLTQTQLAISYSILKWERILFSKAHDMGSTNCSLCVQYKETNKGWCVSCPIFHRTGKQFCEKTPYDAWNDYMKMCHGIRRDAFHAKGQDFSGEMFVFDAVSESLARDELTYLQDLLEIYNGD